MPDKSLGTLAMSVREISSPSPQSNVVYHDEVGITRLQDCREGGGGGSYFCVDIVYFSKNSSSTHFRAI